MGRTQDQAGVGDLMSDDRHQVHQTWYHSVAGIMSRGGGETLLEEVGIMDWVLGCGEYKIGRGWVI
jgi:hypothetical protein